MRRRDFIILVAGAIGGGQSAVRAQQKTMKVIGYLNGTSPVANAPFLAAFRQGLNEAGWVEGQNLAIEYRWADYRYERFRELATDLAERKVDVIAACGGAGEALAAKSITSTIPIVFTVGSDPVETGLVASLARPGGNITGVSILNAQLAQKRVQLISELVPQARVVGYLMNPNNLAIGPNIESAESSAKAKGLQFEIVKAGTETEIDAAFAALAQLHVDVLVVGDPLFDSQSAHVVSLAARYAVPAIYISRKYVSDGGLISYGAIFAMAYRQVGIYAGKILNGAKAADLPVQQSTNFELVINLNTAKALGLTVPQTILARADEVIE
jgi:putative ABC transport system substrate-binding protein